MKTTIQVKNPKSIAFILMLGAFIGLFCETAVNMALSNVMEEFSVTAAIAQWLTTGYLLVLAILVPISAILMKWYTTRQLVIGGLIISLLGVILAAGVKYAFYFTTGISVVSFICSLFVKKPTKEMEKSPVSVQARTETAQR